MMIKLSNVFEYALKAFIFIGVLFYVPFSGGGDPVTWGYAVQDLFFRYGVIVLFALSCMVPRSRQLVFQSLPMLLISIIVTAILFGFGIGMRGGVLSVFTALLFYKIVYEHIDFQKLKSFAWWFGFLLLINLVWCVLQWFGQDMLFTAIDAGVAGKLDTIVGFMRLKVHLGILAALLTPMVVCYAPCFALAIVPLLVFSQSSTAAFAIVVTGLILGFSRKRNLTILLTSIGLLAFGTWFIFFFDMPGGQFGARFLVWRETITMCLKRFFFTGAGVGRFQELNIATIQNNGQPLIWRWVHSEWIQALYEFGVIGVAFILGYVIKIHKKAQSYLMDKSIIALYSSFLTIVILSFVHFPFHLSRFVPIMLFLLAVLHARLEEFENA